MKHTIRAASESDALGINTVSKGLGYSELSSEEILLKFRGILTSTLDQVYVAEEDDQVIGWLHIFYARRLASEDFFEIGGLVVSHEARGKGVGRDLVRYAQDSNNGKFRVRCNELRLGSHRFYEAIGFSSSKVQRVFEAIA